MIKCSRRVAPSSRRLVGADDPPDELGGQKLLTAKSSRLIAKKEGDKWNMKTNSLHALPELHGDFTKRTHFCKKSLSRLSAINFCRLPFTF